MITKADYEKAVNIMDRVKTVAERRARGKGVTTHLTTFTGKIRIYCLETKTWNEYSRHPKECWFDVDEILAELNGN